MSQTQKVQGRATRIEHLKATGQTLVYYHMTAVVTFDDESIWLDNGGYHSVTTKLRMNQASNQFDLGYQVWQETKEWFVTWQGATYRYDYQELRLDRKKGRVTLKSGVQLLPMMEKF